MGDADIIEPEMYPPALADTSDIDRAAEILARARNPPSSRAAAQSFPVRPKSCERLPSSCKRL